VALGPPPVTLVCFWSLLDSHPQSISGADVTLVISTARATRDSVLIKALTGVGEISTSMIIHRGVVMGDMNKTAAYSSYAAFASFTIHV
jgi:hypothetical protein